MFSGTNLGFLKRASVAWVLPLIALIAILLIKPNAREATI